MDQRRRLNAVPHPKRSDALRPVNLMGRYGGEIGSLRYFDTPKPLNRVAKHQRSNLMRELRNFGDRLDHTNLIVDEHDCDNRNAVIQLGLHIFEIEQAVGPDGKARKVKAPPLEPLARIEDRGMLGGDRNDSIAALRLFQRALEGPVESLCRAPGKRQASASEPDRL